MYKVHKIFRINRILVPACICKPQYDHIKRYPWHPIVYFLKKTPCLQLFSCWLSCFLLPRAVNLIELSTTESNMTEKGLLITKSYTL